MRIRIFAILVLIMVLSVLFSAEPLAVRPGAGVQMDCLSPPDGLELPLGQAIGIRCRLEAPSPAVVEFLVDGVLIDSQTVSPGAAAVVAWLPARAGEHVLTMIAYLDGRQLAARARRVRVAPAGSPVRVP